MRWQDLNLSKEGEEMTNRDYLMRLSDRDLAEYMNGDRICDCLTKCPECNCADCITEWLKAERKPDVKKGQIRRSDSGRCHLVFYVKNNDECLILTENGILVRTPTRDVSTWDVVENADVDEFLERMIENL